MLLKDLNKMKTKVAVVIVTYNRLPLLKECIDSIRAQTYTDFSIIVINNGSTDGTEAWLKEQNDVIVVTQENLGGAGGFYTGIKYSCEYGYAYSWVMDDDVVCHKDALKSMMCRVSSTSGFLCSRVVYPNGSPCNVPEISKRKNKETGELLWGERLDDGLLRVETASFVSVLIDNRVVGKIGLPLKEYFIWGDDSEYTNRISRVYPSYLVVDSVVTHKRAIQRILSIAEESDKQRMKNYYYFYRNTVHRQKSLLKKSICFCRYFILALMLFLRGKWPASSIVFKGIFAALFFSPHITFPSNA